MSKTVQFRDFEERDIDFIYKCKNDEKLNRLIVGNWHPFTYEEAADWVHGCMGEHDSYRFWAICTNDEEKRIIGWVSLSQIDLHNKSAFFHGIVIADPRYRDGLAEIEVYSFVYNVAFIQMGLDVVFGASLLRQGDSQLMSKAFYCERDGIESRVVCRNGIWYDKSYSHLYKKDYLQHLENGDYETMSVIKRIIKLKKLARNENIR